MKYKLTSFLALQNKLISVKIGGQRDPKIEYTVTTLTLEKAILLLSSAALNYPVYSYSIVAEIIGSFLTQVI